MNKILLAAILTTLTACGGSGGGDNNSAPATKTPSGSVSNTNDKLMITGDYNTVTVTKTKKSEINVSGKGNTIYIQSSISTLDIVGDDNTLEISNGVTVDDCNIVGSNNKATKPSSLKLECKITGTTNTGFN